MDFSNRAYQYFDELSRDDEFVIEDKNQVIECFEKSGIPLFEKVIDFQMNYSGLKLTISGKPFSTFNAQLLSHSDVVSNLGIDFLKINEQYYFYCGDHETAQFWFVLSQYGELCTYNNNNESVNIIFSTFEKFIESYAFENLLSISGKYEQPGYYELIDKPSFEIYTEKFIRHTSASDNYNIWFSNETMTIYQGTWLDRAVSFVHIYGDNKTDCEKVLVELKRQKIIA